jgi:predicted amidohydrolase YtcJ
MIASTWHGFGLQTSRLTVAAISLVLVGTRAAEAQPADVVLLGGTVCTVDDEDRVAEGLAVRGERIVAVGSDDEISRHIGPQTRVIELEGKTVVPGFIETHTHALGAARAELVQPWVDLDSIPAIQDWLSRGDSPPSPPA